MLDQHRVVQFLRAYGANKLADIAVERYPWEAFIRQARRVNLLSRCAVFLRETGLLDKVPQQARIHFINAIKLSDANARSAQVEVQALYKTLRTAKLDFVLLKGAAYVCSGLDAGKGRLFTDTDILVSKENLSAVEQTLARKGWFTRSLDHYTQKFYREWMHEIPPMTHLKRQTTLDVHHTILPPTSRLKPNVQQLWRHVDVIQGMQGLFVLSPFDMIIHSATHLFHEGEFDQGLRDISDLDLLIRQGVVEQAHWSALLIRAKELDLVKPVYYALNFTYKILQTPVPENIILEARQLANMNSIAAYMMDTLYGLSLVSTHETHVIKGQSIARWLLYIRSHWLKMPVYLLVPHLARKSYLRLTGQRDHD